AIQLAQGDFSHRVKRVGQDEIGAVATAFNEMARQVESMIEEQRAFASNTSHELRTPLTAIRLRSEALRY
ncbi:HAMP domain-containing protein, partial [Candidatus Saccharibacteria bacterium]|nr:HAMP domain-containing protein [Candidatus Saccharibacteria bacterium]